MIDMLLNLIFWVLALIGFGTCLIIGFWYYVHLTVYWASRDQKN